MVRLFLPQMPYTKTINLSNFFPTIYNCLLTDFIHIGKFHINLSIILCSVWVEIALIHYIKIVRNYINLKRVLNLFPNNIDTRFKHIFLRLYPKAAEKPNHRFPKIIVHNSIGSPSIVGFFHPVILLPDIDFTEDELFGILAHEWGHYRYGHVFIKLLIECIQYFFWWNIFFKILIDEISHILEVSADKFVCKNLTEKQRSSYLKAILKVVHHQQTISSFSITCGLIENETSRNLIQRFRIILNNKHKNKYATMILLTPCILFLFLFSYMFVLQPYIEPINEDFLSATNNHDYLTPTDTLTGFSSPGYDLCNTEHGIILGLIDIDNTIPLALNGFMDYSPDKPLSELPIYDVYRNTPPLFWTNSIIISSNPLTQKHYYYRENSIIISPERELTGYRYIQNNGKLWKRLWSYNCGKWIEPEWTLA